jgi:hypothetical protein
MAPAASRSERVSRTPQAMRSGWLAWTAFYFVARKFLPRIQEIEARLSLIDLRFCFTYTSRMRRGWASDFSPRNSRTNIISVSSSFSEGFTSHSQLGHASIALAFLDKIISPDNNNYLGNH